MEKIIYVSSIEFENKFKEFDRLYFGSDTCEELLPSIQLLRQLKDKHNISITLVTPPVTDKGIERIKNLVEENEKERVFDEVVVNDIGALDFLSKQETSLTFIAGRLLSIILKNNTKMQESYKLSRFSGHHNETRLPLDIYTPYSLLAVTRLCKYRYSKESFDEENNRNCPQYCASSTISLSNSMMKDIVLKGNAHLRKQEHVPRINTEDRNIFEPVTTRDFEDRDIQKPFVSVIIPTYNNSKKLQIVVKKLLEQEYPKEKYEIIIADDGSFDETQRTIKELQSKHDNIRYCFQEDKGFRAGQARNLGASIAKGDYLIFFDQDIIPHPNTIQHYIKHLRQYDVVLGYTSGYYSKKQHNTSDFSQDFNRIKIQKEFRHDIFFDDKGNTSSLNNTLWQNFVSNNYGIKKEVFLKEQYNNQFSGWGGEDEEYGYRLQKKGYSIVLKKDCLAYHLPHEDENIVGIYTEKKVESLLNNFVKFYELHPNTEIKEHIFQRYENLPEQFKTKERKEFMEKKIHYIDELFHCNNHCIFCNQRLKVEKNKNAFFCNRDSQKGFLKQVKKQKEEGKKVIVTTNGRLFAIEKFTRIASRYIDKLTLIYHGNTAEEHDVITQVPGSYKQAKQGEQNIKKYNIPLDIKNIGWHTNNTQQFYEKPQEVILEVTANCNFNCEGCFNKNTFAQEGRNIEEMSREYIKEIIDNVAKAGIPKIRFSGGEPLLRKDLLELLKYAKSKKLIVWMNSNATLITEEKAKELKPYIDNILVSLNGYDDETDGKWTCTPNSFSRKVQGIKILQEQGIDVRCGTVATPDNIIHLEKIHTVVKKLGVKQWEVYRPIYKDMKSLDIRTLYNKLVNITLETGQWHPIGNIIPLCSMNSKQLHILTSGGKSDDGHSRITVDPRGFAKPDYFSETNIGDPRDIMACWNHPHMKKIRNLEYLPKECKNCKLKDKCKGGSRELSYALHGTYDQPDPLARFENKLVQ